MPESPKAKAIAEQYVLLGPGRSLAKLHQQLHGGNLAVSLRQLEYYSAKYGWVERAARWDAEQAEAHRKKVQDDIDKMNERQAMMGVTLQQKMLAHTLKLLEADSFGAIATVQALKLGLDVERIARGLPADRASIEVTGRDGEPLPQPYGHVAVYLPQKNPPPEREIVEANEAEGE